MRNLSLAASAAAVLAAATFAPVSASAADIEVPTEAVAETSAWYVSLHGGIKFGEEWQDHFLTHCGSLYCEEEWDVDLDTDNGWRVGGAVGYLFSDIFAIEGELAYMTQDFDEVDLPHVKGHPDDWEWDGDVSIFTGMINLIAGVLVADFVRPYVGAGAGFAHVSLDDISEGFLDDSDTSFAVQGFAGVDFGLTDNVGLGIRGRLLHIGDLDFEDDDDCDHEIDVDLIKSVEAVLTIGF